MISLLLAALSACAPDPADARATPRLEIVGARVSGPSGERIEAVHVALADDGTGSAEQVDAHLPASSAGPAPPPLEIHAARSAWDLKMRVVTFRGDVEARRGDLVLHCDELTVRYAGPERVEQAEADGHVVIERGERRAEGAHARLDPDTGRLELTGSPMLTDGTNRMTGERIVLWLDDRKVDCEKCKLEVAGEAVAPRAARR